MILSVSHWTFLTKELTGITQPTANSKVSNRGRSLCDKFCCISFDQLSCINGYSLNISGKSVFYIRVKHNFGRVFVGNLK